MSIQPVPLGFPAQAFRMAQTAVMVSGGAALVAIERMRQIDDQESGGEGYADEHDDRYRDGELVRAACCYAHAAGGYSPSIAPVWPWGPEFDKRPAPDASDEEKVRALEKAGALLCAEIDRLHRQIRRRREASK